MPFSSGVQARSAKRDLFNNFTPILLHPQAILKFKRFSLEALSAKIPDCNKQGQRIRVSILFGLLAQIDSSTKKKGPFGLLTLIAQNLYEEFLSTQ